MPSIFLMMIMLQCLGSLAWCMKQVAADPDNIVIVNSAVNVVCIESGIRRRMRLSLEQGSIELLENVDER